MSKPSIQRRSGSDPSEVANATDLGDAIENTPTDTTLRCVSRFLGREISYVEISYRLD